MSKPGIFSCLLFIILVPFAGTGQIHISCCQLNLTIPKFVDEKDTVFTNNILIKEKVLPPIMQSSSPMEIRLYQTFEDNSSFITVIHCVHEQMELVLYKVGSTSDTTSLKGQYIRTLGTYNKKYNGFLYLEAIDHFSLIKYPSWNSYLIAFINNHLFDLKGDPELSQLVTKRNKNIKVDTNPLAFTLIEIKADKRYRSINKNTRYINIPKNNPVHLYANGPDNVKELKYLQNIYSLLTTLIDYDTRKNLIQER